MQQPESVELGIFVVPRCIKLKTDQGRGEADGVVLQYVLAGQTVELSEV